MFIPKYKDAIPNHESLNVYSETYQRMDKYKYLVSGKLPKSYFLFPRFVYVRSGINESFPFMANTLQHLILNNKIPNYILVGITNTNRNKNLTTLTTQVNDLKWVKEFGGFDAFSNFICIELITIINKKYKTTTVNGILGESLAGLFVLQMFLKHNLYFKYYIAFDPSVWWNNHKIISDFKLFFESEKPINKFGLQVLKLKIFKLILISLLKF